jgi:hypothetical protein
MHEWLDNWSGLVLIVAGMTHQGGISRSQPTRRATGARTSSRSTSPTPSSAARLGVDAVAGGAAGGVPHAVRVTEDSEGKSDEHTRG